MANDYLLYKWKLWFKVLGAKDGLLTRQIAVEEEEKFAYLHHFGVEKKQYITGKLNEWWEKFIFRRKPGSITEEEYVAMQNDDYKADKEQYTKWVEACAKEVFDILDIDNDGMINEEELLIAHSSAGFDNSQQNKDLFNSFEPVNGKITVKKMVDTWVVFLTSEDSSQKDIIKDSFEVRVGN